jgi:hypothetical protein
VPLALVGALCGGFLAAVIVGKDPRTAHDQENTPVGVLAPGETMPGEPMLWQPIPAVGARALTTGDVAPTSQTSLRTRRVRRAIRERGYSHHDNHSRTSHTATRH